MQPGGPPLLAGSIVADAITRAARWADGLCGFSFTLASDELESAFGCARAAWAAAGRPAPRLVTGCWFSLGPNGRAAMDAYLARYLNFLGEGGRSLAALVETTDAGALRAAVRRARDAGADELLLVPTTADPDEVARVADILG